MEKDYNEIIIECVAGVAILALLGIGFYYGKKAGIVAASKGLKQMLDANEKLKSAYYETCLELIEKGVINKSNAVRVDI